VDSGLRRAVVGKGWLAVDSAKLTAVAQGRSLNRCQFHQLRPSLTL
jgi:hypothetical protein